MDIDAPYLPQEIILNIIKRLPVKSLIRFQCVCKDGKNLFKAPSFIAEHVRHATQQDPAPLFKSCGYKCNLEYFCLINRDMPVLEYQTPPSSVRGCGIIGSSNGLLCLVYKSSFILWNPAIREVHQEKEKRKMAAVHVINVGSANLGEELERIRVAIKTHRFVFTSVLGSFSMEAVDGFELLSDFLNLTKLIQIGMTLSNENGEVFNYSWQFNFSGFDQDQDAHDPHHIMRLQQGGVDFKNNWHHGVPWDYFMSHMERYNLLGNGELHWIAFDGAFCFGQLIKFVHGNLCPPADAFFTSLRRLFPICYDVNPMMRSTNHVPVSIEDVANLLRVRVVGDEVSPAATHSVLTCEIFHKLNHLATHQLRGVLHGTGG